MQLHIYSDYMISKHINCCMIVGIKIQQFLINIFGYLNILQFFNIFTNIESLLFSYIYLFYL